MKIHIIAEFITSLDPDEEAHIELPHLNLHYLLETSRYYGFDSLQE